MPEQIIIHNSRWAAERDNFFFENPEYILYIGIVCVIVAVTVIIFQSLKDKFKRRR